MCRRLCDLTDQISSFYKDITLPHAVNFKSEDLARILKHSNAFERFVIPYGTFFECSVSELDYVFVKHFKCAPSLYWFGICDCPISTLCFLTQVPNIQILQISGCDNLQNCDFSVLKQCQALDQLHLPFANVEASTIIDIANGKKPICYCSARS